MGAPRQPENLRAEPPARNSFYAGQPLKKPSCRRRAAARCKSRGLGSQNRASRAGGLNLPPRPNSESHSAITSKGRQHTSQSVVNRWKDTLVSTTISNACPQNGHWMVPETSIPQSNPAPANRNFPSSLRQETKRAGETPARSYFRQRSRTAWSVSGRWCCLPAGPRQEFHAHSAGT